MVGELSIILQRVFDQIDNCKDYNYENASEMPEYLGDLNDNITRIQKALEGSRQAYELNWNEYLSDMKLARNELIKLVATALVSISTIDAEVNHNRDQNKDEIKL